MQFRFKTNFNSYFLTNTIPLAKFFGIFNYYVAIKLTSGQ